VLYYKPNIPLALIEAKDNSYGVGDGMQQGLDYATTLHIPFVFSSNGDGFVFHDRTGSGGATETNLSLNEFPPPAELWGRYRAWKGLTDEAEQIVLVRSKRTAEVSLWYSRSKPSCFASI
jgi:type I restriction enzyme R subunit